jgi:hypothetical protein
MLPCAAREEEDGEFSSTLMFGIGISTRVLGEGNRDVSGIRSGAEGTP